MSIELVEAIINGDLVNAQDIFEQRLNDIREGKLYEEKRRLAALDEIFGGMTKKDVEDRRERGYKRASEVLGDPTRKLKPLVKLKPVKKKKVTEETLDEAGLAPTRVGKVYRAARYAQGAIKNPKAAAAVAGERLKAAGRIIRNQMAKKSAEKAQSSDSPFPQGMHQTQTSTDTLKRPGRLQRNINTLMGREPGYIKPEKTPEQKGGRAGKAIRMAGQGIGKAYSGWGNVLSRANSGTLE